MNDHPIQGLAAMLRRAGDPPLPTWDEYETATDQRQQQIKATWFAVGHGYRGSDPVARDIALKLYCRTCPRPRMKLVRQSDAEWDADYSRQRGDWNDPHETYNKG